MSQHLTRANNIVNWTTEDWMCKVVQWITALVVLGWQFGCGMDLSCQQWSMQTGGSSIMFGEYTGLLKQAIDQWLTCGSASWPFALIHGFYVPQQW